MILKRCHQRTMEQWEETMQGIPVSTARGAKHTYLGIGIAEMRDFKVLRHPSSFKGHKPAGTELLMLWTERVAVVTATQTRDIADLKINILTCLLICRERVIQIPYRIRWRC